MKKTDWTAIVAVTALLAALIGAGNSFADTTLDVQASAKSGVTPTRISSALSSTETYKVRNGETLFLLLEKSGAGDATISIGVPLTVGGLTISSQTITVPASTGDKVIGPFPARIFNDANGDMKFTISDTVGLSVAILKL